MESLIHPDHSLAHKNHSLTLTCICLSCCVSAMQGCGGDGAGWWWGDQAQEKEQVSSNTGHRRRGSCIWLSVCGLPGLTYAAPAAQGTAAEPNPAVCCGVPALTVASLLLQDRAPAQHSEGGGCVCVCGGGGSGCGKGRHDKRWEMISYGACVRVC
jgi:hypothetical protein